MAEQSGEATLKELLGSILPHRTAFNLLATLLRRIVRSGSLTVIDPWRARHVFGTGKGPFATIRISDPGEPARLIANPELRFGEAYMDGVLTIERGTLRDFLLIVVGAATELAKDRGAFRKLVPAPLRRLRRGNSIARAQANAAHHYDLSEQLYRLFLDPDLQYSCGYFQDGTETLEQAQAKKKRHLAAKLLLRPGLRVLEIGSGWGGLALQLARDEAVEVDGLTLSREQLASAQARARDEGLHDRARFHLRDYRDEGGAYDRIVSVGMFEHVGALHYQEFFNVVRRALSPRGVAVIHAIGSKGPPGRANAWIERYIFPGGYCPSLSEVLAAVERSGLWVTDVEILRLHYAETLQHWSERFQARREDAAALYDERFCRMWEFYLAACEACFRVGDMMVFQLQLAGERDAAPLTRDYIGEFESRGPAVRARPTREAAAPARVGGRAEPAGATVP